MFPCKVLWGMNWLLQIGEFDADRNAFRVQGSFVALVLARVYHTFLEKPHLSTYEP